MFADYLGSLRAPAGARRGSGTTGHRSGTGDRASGKTCHGETIKLPGTNPIGDHGPRIRRQTAPITGHGSAARCSCNASRITGQLARIRARGPRPGLEKNRPERRLTGSTCCGPTAAGRALCDTKKFRRRSRGPRNKKAPRRALVAACKPVKRGGRYPLPCGDQGVPRRAGALVRGPAIRRTAGILDRRPGPLRVRRHTARVQRRRRRRRRRRC